MEKNAYHQEAKEKVVAELKSLVLTGKSATKENIIEQLNTKILATDSKRHGTECAPRVETSSNIWTEFEETDKSSDEFAALLKEHKILQNLLNKKSKEYDEQLKFWKDKYQNMVKQTLQLEVENSELQEEIIGLNSTVEELEFTVKIKEHETSNLIKELERLRNIVANVADYQKKVTELEGHTAKIQRNQSGGPRTGGSNANFKGQVELIGQKVQELETSNVNLYEQVQSDELREKHQSVMAQMHALRKEINQIVQPSNASYAKIKEKDVSKVQQHPTGKWKFSETEI